MCGICGFIRIKKSESDSETLLKMGNTIRHRGPDAHGEYIDDDIGLAHRRLSIIDLSVSGNQPMFSNDGIIVLVFNGEIYNFQELRQEALNRGYQFKTRTDTEVIIALYQFYGSGLLDKLNGMFAFALWDKSKKLLFMARDRLGKKPLYFYENGNQFIFSSEIKSILAYPGVEKEVRTDAVYDFFTYQYIPDPKTIFANIHKLEPGHYMELQDGKIKKRQYWDLTFTEPTASSEEEITEELYNLINQSVQDRMVSDVPLGAFLSGGIDSSAVVGMMAKSQTKPVITCSIGFDSEKFDEIEYAREIANLFGTDHHEFTVKSTVNDRLKEIVSFFDEPFADPSLVPTFFVSELARQEVTVALAGDGGDENFAGYSKYAIDDTENRIRRMIPSGLRRNVLPLIKGLLPDFNHPLFNKAHTLLNTLTTSPDYGFFLSNAFFRDEMWQQIIRDDFRKQLSDYHPATLTLNHYKNADSNDHLSSILYTDFKTYLPGDILVKVDRMSMANSLEVRAPLLDYRVVEYVAGISSRLKLKNGEKKHILKKCFSKLLPGEILYRKKMGFSTPLAEWFRGEIKDLSMLYLLADDNGISNFFKPEKINELWQLHQSGRFDFSTELWSFLMFEMWWQRYMSGSISLKQ